MARSTHFFGLASNIKDLKASAIATKAKKWLSQQEREDEAELTRLIDQICNGKIPNECKEEWFDAMFSIAMANFEHIQFESLVGLRASDTQVEDVGLLLPSLGSSPRFAIPKSRQAYPCIGFIGCEQMEHFSYKSGGKVSAKDMAELNSEVDVLLAELGMATSEKSTGKRGKSKIDSSQVDGLRADIDYMFETLREDQLDLLITYF